MQTPAAAENDSTQLRAENTALKLALAEAHRELEKYQKGLEKAVDELNRLASIARQPVSVSIEAPRARPRGALYSIAGPRVIPLGDKVIVDGLLFNAGVGEVETSVDLVLFANGRAEDRVTIDVSLGPGGELPYGFEFPARFASATYTARLDF